MIIDEAAMARIQAFSDKHCRGKVARVDLLIDMCRVLDLRLTVKITHPLMQQK